MKTLKLRKILLTITCAMLLVALTVGATYAYLTSTASVQNTFTVGNVIITMDETDVDNSTPDKDRDTANSYHLLPGQTYTKDPIVHVDPVSENCWVFIKVDNQLANIEGENTIAKQIRANGWKELDGVPGVYYQSYTKGQKDKDLKTFAEVQIAATVDNDTLAGYNNNTVTINAYAIQADGIGTAAEAWKLGNWN